MNYTQNAYVYKIIAHLNVTLVVEYWSKYWSKKSYALNENSVIFFIGMVWALSEQPKIKQTDVVTIYAIDLAGV